MSQIELRFNRAATSSSSRTRRPGRAGFIFLLLFGLPFLGVGLFTGYQTLAGGMSFDGPYGRLMMGVFSLVFAGSGATVMALAFRSRTLAAQQAELEARHPGQPWMWRSDWASGRLRSNSALTVKVAWGVSLFWNLLSTPMLFALPEELRKGNHLILIGLIFPLVGAGMVVWAIRSTIRWIRFGDSFLEMARVPAALGGTLEAQLQTGLPRGPTEQMKLTLNCVNRITTGSGKNRSTHDSILWQEEAVVPRGSLGSGPRGVQAPVSFRIPRDQPECRDTNPSNKILWMLRAEASVPGVDYDAQFKIPVFDTGEVAHEDPAAASDSRPAAGLAAPELSRGIRIHRNAEGLQEFYFGPARNPAAAFGTTCFLAIWIGAIVFQVKLGAPVLFPIVFGVFGLLIGIATIDMWLSVSRVIVHSGEVESRGTILGIGRNRFFPNDQIAGIRPKVGMQMRYGSRGIPFYDLAIRKKGGKEKILARSIRNKREAEWLAAEMERAANLQG